MKATWVNLITVGGCFGIWAVGRIVYLVTDSGTLGNFASMIIPALIVGFACRRLGPLTTQMRSVMVGVLIVFKLTSVYFLVPDLKLLSMLIMIVLYSAIILGCITLGSAVGGFGSSKEPSSKWFTSKEDAR